jgi:hypothetical protein
MPVDIKTVVLHCKKLVDRKSNMVKQLTKFGFSDFSFYEDYDGVELTDDVIHDHCVRKAADPQTVLTKISLWKIGLNTQRELSIAEISLTIKFGKVFQLLSKIDADQFIVFEDDVILCDDFDIHFNRFLKNTPNDWDAIYFGSGANLKPENITSDKTAYKMEHPASRCADSIVLKKSAVCDLARTWFPFHLISDWELGYQHSLHNHKVYWWEPSLVLQGSEHGLFKSTLR